MTDTRVSQSTPEGGPPEPAPPEEPSRARHQRRDYPTGRDLQPPSTPPPPTRRDYRLRGLDLGPSPGASGPGTASSTLSASRRRARARRRRNRRLITLASVVVVVVLVAVLVRAVLIAPFTVPSSAMAPTLQAGDRILVLRSNFLTGSIGRGDIIVFRRPGHFPCRTSGGSGQYLVQRVIGLPGETVSSDHGTVYVDGKPLAERGWYDPRYGALNSLPISTTTVPRGDYFVMSDNRSDTCDSRSFGAIPASATVGKVVAIIARNGDPYLHLL